jgi:hypothetical protein
MRAAVAIALGIVLYEPIRASEQAAGEPATVMGRLAASMKPGELTELKTQNCSWDLFKSYYDWEDNLRGAHKGYSIVSWSNDANWDSKTRQLFYFGLGHYASPKFVKYSADTNEWTLLELPEWADKCMREDKRWIVGHTYDKEGLSPEHRLFVVNWDGLYLYDIDSGKWSLAEGARSSGKDAYQVLEYFPDMRAFVYEANWGRNLQVWDVDRKASRRLGSYPFGIHGVMEYNPVHRVMLFGGGDAGDTAHPNLYLIDAKGKVKKLKAPPVWLRCTPEAKLTCDPVSGDYLVQGREAEKMYAFHPLRDEWKELPVRAPNGLAAQIGTYGVVMFVPGDREGKVYLYRHKPQWPDDGSGG